MTDERSIDRALERAARSWIEVGPTRAPDRPVEAALALIQTTNQGLEAFTVTLSAPNWEASRSAIIAHRRSSVL